MAISERVKKSFSLYRKYLKKPSTERLHACFFACEPAINHVYWKFKVVAAEDFVTLEEDMRQQAAFSLLKALKEMLIPDVLELYSRSVINFIWSGMATILRKQTREKPPVGFFDRSPFRFKSEKSQDVEDFFNAIPHKTIERAKKYLSNRTMSEIQKEGVIAALSRVISGKSLTPYHVYRYHPKNPRLLYDIAKILFRLFVSEQKSEFKYLFRKRFRGDIPIYPNFDD